jgi:hypothetical protein
VHALNWREATMPRFGALLVLGSSLALLACTDTVGPVDETPTNPQITVAALIVSEPVASPAASASVTAATGAGSAAAAGSGTAASASYVTYVSLPPGALTDIVSVRIRNATTGGAATGDIPVIDGGFDPISMAAGEGDVLELEFTHANGDMSVSEAVVPARLPPRIVRTSPPRGRTDIALKVRPTVIFSEPVEALTVTTTSLRLVTGGAAVDGEVALLADEPWVAEFTPAAPLEPQTTYELVVTTVVRDLDGQALEEELRVQFTTEAYEGLAIVSGNNQPGKAGQELAEPFVVRVTDAQGAGIEGVEVTWTVTSGEGVLDGLWTRCDIPGTPGWEKYVDPIPTTSVHTDAAGVARVPFMPTWFGPVTVKAEATGVSGVPVTFTTDASDPGATLEIAPGYEHSPRIWAWLNHNQKLVIRVKDGQGEDVPYVPVNWRVESGTGELFEGCRMDPAALTVRTSQSVDFKHKAYGLSTVSAAVPGVQDSPVMFELEATLVVVYVDEKLDEGFLGPEGSSDIVVQVGARVEFLLFNPTAHIVSTSSPPGGASFDSGILQDNSDHVFNYPDSPELFGFVPNVAGTWEFVDQVSGATGTLTATPVMNADGTGQAQ